MCGRTAENASLHRVGTARSKPNPTEDPASASSVDPTAGRAHDLRHAASRSRVRRRTQQHRSCTLQSSRPPTSGSSPMISTAPWVVRERVEDLKGHPGRRSLIFEAQHAIRGCGPTQPTGTRCPMTNSGPPSKAADRLAFGLQGGVPSVECRGSRAGTARLRGCEGRGRTRSAAPDPTGGDAEGTRLTAHAAAVGLTAGSRWPRLCRMTRRRATTTLAICPAQRPRKGRRTQRSRRSRSSWPMGRGRAAPAATPECQVSAQVHELAPRDEDRVEDALVRIGAVRAENTSRAAREAGVGEAK